MKVALLMRYERVNYFFVTNFMTMAVTTKQCFHHQQLFNVCMKQQVIKGVINRGQATQAADTRARDRSEKTQPASITGGVRTNKTQTGTWTMITI